MSAASEVVIVCETPSGMFIAAGTELLTHICGVDVTVTFVSVAEPNPVVTERAVPNSRVAPLFVIFPSLVFDAMVTLKPDALLSVTEPAVMLVPLLTPTAMLPRPMVPPTPLPYGAFKDAIEATVPFMVAVLRWPQWPTRWERRPKRLAGRATASAAPASSIAAWPRP